MPNSQNSKVEYITADEKFVKSGGDTGIQPSNDIVIINAVSDDTGDKYILDKSESEILQLTGVDQYGHPLKPIILILDGMIYTFNQFSSYGPNDVFSFCSNFAVGSGDDPKTATIIAIDIIFNKLTGTKIHRKEAVTCLKEDRQ